MRSTPRLKRPRHMCKAREIAWRRALEFFCRRMKQNHTQTNTCVLDSQTPDVGDVSGSLRGNHRHTHLPCPKIIHLPPYADFHHAHRSSSGSPSLSLPPLSLLRYISLFPSITFLNLTQGAACLTSSPLWPAKELQAPPASHLHLYYTDRPILPYNQ